MTVPRPHRDIVVIGASAGGVAALQRLVAGLPPDLAAAVFIVQHTSPTFASRLPELLMRHGPLKASHAIHGESVVPGRIYVAPPDNHLLVRPGYVEVVRGAKENGHRPAVDALFRTASAAYGPRVIGVVLTGYLDCGTAGLISIKARGGVAVAQDPDDAEAPSMPRSAIVHAQVDHIVALNDVPAYITRLVDEPADPWPAHLPGALHELEGDERGVAAEVVCPICQGQLTESELNGFLRYRCHVGHAFSIESIAAGQADETERALWAAVRSLEESASLSRRFGSRAIGAMKARFAEREAEQNRQADIIRQLLLRGGQLNSTDAAALEKARLAPEEAESKQN